MTLQERLRKEKEQARRECDERGYHRWDRLKGRIESSGGGTKVVGGLGCMDGPEEIEIPRRTWYQRTCVDCGYTESVGDNRVWLAEAGYGHFECDPVTGQREFVRHDGSTEYAE